MQALFIVLLVLIKIVSIAGTWKSEKQTSNVVMFYWTFHQFQRRQCGGKIRQCSSRQKLEEIHSFNAITINNSNSILNY